MKKLFIKIMQADRWAHHHTLLVLGGIFLCGFMAFWQVFMPQVQTHAATLDCNTATNIVVGTGECQALMDLYASTNGQSRTTGTNRGTDTNVCNRYGITCSRDSHVSDIVLHDNNLSGTLPNSVGDLHRLRSLAVYRNHLYGSIPSSLWTIQTLMGVYIGNNNFSGTVTNDLSLVTGFERLDLAQNSNLTINMNVFNSLDHSLIMLDITSLHVVGDLTIIGTLTGLQELTIDNIDYTGDINEIWPTISVLHNLQRLKLKNLNLSGNLPDIWNNFPVLNEISLQFNNFIGSLPPSFSNMTALHNLVLSANHFDGPIPASFTGITQGDISTNCFDTDVTDQALLSSLNTSLQGWDNQYNCRANLETSGSIAGNGLLPGTCSIYTLSYDNVGPQVARNVIIRQLFDSHLTVSGSIPSYTTGFVGREYGTMNDPCYASAALSATGPYFAPFEQILQSNYGAPSLYGLAVNALGFTGAQGTNEFQYILDNGCPFLFDIHNDPVACLMQFGLDLSTVNPSCGTGGELGYVWDIGDVPNEMSGDIEVNLCVPQNLTGSVFFSSMIATTSTNENGNGGTQLFTFSIQNNQNTGNSEDDTGNATLPSNPHHGGGSSSPVQIDTCLPNPPGDQSSSYYDGDCESNSITGNHNSASLTNTGGYSLGFIPTLQEVKTYIHDFPSNVLANVEQIQAFLFAKAAGLTGMESFETLRPFDGITRAEFSKLLVEFLANIVHREPDISRLQMCSKYSDVNKNLGDLQTTIYKACMYKIMGLQNNGNTPLQEFNPNEVMKRKYIVTTLSRLIWGDKYDNAEPFYVKHMQAMQTAGLINNTDPEIVELRINAFTIMMRIAKSIDTLFR